MGNPNKTVAKKNDLPSVENPAGIFRTTLSYGPSVMMCHFNMKKGAQVPLHSHAAAQNGYMIKGKIRFRHGETGSFIAEPGSSWFFDGNQPHGAEVLEDSEVIECFSPMRPEYT
jgi:quercetin dioxygenase-like cupin family protein